MQLYDQMIVRHGIMLVGPTGGGKTVARNILEKALQFLPQNIQKKDVREEPAADANKRNSILVNIFN